MIRPEPVPDMVSTGTCVAEDTALVKGGSHDLSMATSIFLSTGYLVGDRLAARCCEFREVGSRYREWEGIGVRWGERKLAGCARGGSRLDGLLF